MPIIIVNEKKPGKSKSENILRTIANIAEYAHHLSGRADGASRLFIVYFKEISSLNREVIEISSLSRQSAFNIIMNKTLWKDPFIESLDRVHSDYMIIAISHRVTRLRPKCSRLK